MFERFVGSFPWDTAIPMGEASRTQTHKTTTGRTLLAVYATVPVAGSSGTETEQTQHTDLEPPS